MIIKNYKKEEKNNKVQTFSLPKFVGSEIISPVKQIDEAQEIKEEIMESIKNNTYVESYEAKDHYEEVTKQKIEKDINNAYQKGIAEGKAQGVEEGIKKGFEQGKLEGEKQGKQITKQEYEQHIKEIEVKIEQSIANIAQTINFQDQLLTKTNEHYKIVTQSLAKSLIETIIVNISENDAYNKVEEIVQKAFEYAAGKEKIVITANSKIIEKIENNINKLAAQKGFNGEIEFSKDDNLQLLECNVDWQYGGLDFSNINILKEMDKIVSEFIANKADVTQEELLQEQEHVGEKIEDNLEEKQEEADQAQENIDEDKDNNESNT